MLDVGTAFVMRWEFGTVKRYTFSTFAKARWVHQTILHVYATEFGSYPLDYYRHAIDTGRILVSNQTVTSSYRIQAGDVLTHTVHRHEPAVAVASQTFPYVTVVAETNDLLIVDNPSTFSPCPSLWWLSRKFTHEITATTTRRCCDRYFGIERYEQEQN